MEEPFFARALLVRDGKILAVGEHIEAPDARRVNLEGKALMPAFIDAHSHIAAYAQTFATADLSGAKSFDELCRRLLSFQSENNIGDGEWIVGYGYDQNLLAEGRHPDKQVLDSVLPGCPVMISNISGHMGVANSLGLKRLGVTADTRDPDGGKIGRMPGSADPDGFLEEKAFTGCAPGVLALTEDRQRQILKKAQQEYLRRGVTTVQDGLTRDTEWGMLSLSADAGELLVDVVCYADEKDAAHLTKQNPGYLQKYKNHLKIGGYKVILDGSPQGRTAWMSQPYLDAPDGYCGYPAYSDEQVLDFFRKARRESMQILAHANGDAAAEQMIRCLTPDFSSLRPVMIHAQFVREDQLRRMGPLGVLPSFFVAHVNRWAAAHEKNLGLLRARCMSPARTALELGLPFTFHQDTPVLPPDMLHTVWTAVNRIGPDGTVIGPGQRIPVDAALRAVTINAAYQYFEEGQKGSLRPGKAADLVILSRDPTAVPPMELKDIEVLCTIKDGRLLYRR